MLWWSFGSSESVSDWSVAGNDMTCVALHVCFIDEHVHFVGVVAHFPLEVSRITWDFDDWHSGSKAIGYDTR